MGRLLRDTAYFRYTFRFLVSTVLFLFPLVGSTGWSATAQPQVSWGGKVQSSFQKSMDEMHAYLIKMEKSPSHPEIFQVIWLLGAITDPSTSRIILNREVKTIQKRTPLQRAWWILARWETFVMEGDKTFLADYMGQMDSILDQFDKKNPLKQLKKDPFSMELVLVMAQAWRVTGNAHGVLRNRGRSLFCENRFQQYRQILRRRLQEKMGKEDISLIEKAKLWKILPGEPVSYRTAMGKLLKLPCIETAVVVLRDQVGIRGYPFELGFEPNYPCRLPKRFLLENFSYRQGILQIAIKGCGLQLQSLQVNGKKQDRIFGDIKGDQDVVLRVH